MERHALSARLVACFNKVKIKGIAEKILLNHTFVISRRLGDATSHVAGSPRGGASHVALKSFLFCTIYYIIW